MLNKINLFVVFLFIYSPLFSEECNSNSTLKIGLYKNQYIDYRYYLYYTLGEYASNKSIDYELSYLDNNANEFDIIFGEYYDLEKLSLKSISYPKKIENFYQANNIEINHNIFPLDLDTFVIITKSRSKEMNFEELSKIQDPIRYTLGMSFAPPESFFKIFNYSLNSKVIGKSDNIIEFKLNTFKEAYKNINKNILINNYQDVYNSYQGSENLFTLFSDGVLLNKDIEFEDFYSFPNSKYLWNEEKGHYEINQRNNIPFSFYGFSAYLNNSNQNGFICYLISEDLRLKSFRNFNIELSPLSLNELNSIVDTIPVKYKELLEIKNKKIYKEDYSRDLNNYKDYIDIIFGKKNYIDLFSNFDYLNH